IVIAGTGSSTYGRNQHGDEGRAGGHGSFLDDMGSATDLGRRAAQAVLRASDGRGPPTALTAAILAHLHAESEAALPALLGARGDERTRTAQLAPVVTAAAEQGDQVSLDILKDAAAALAPSALAVANRLGLKKPTIVAVGGLVASSPLYRDILHAALLRLIEDASVQGPVHSSAYGAALLALRLLAAED
ncbi:MAG TPA: BadF/BadG/BcrA/BcrD ATPase family protein, partial [Planctomycetota bacterium]|nr:BadF/BadG/BcrA/BcrD ATPase family protein [Planctomycetota bacterium]